VSPPAIVATVRIYTIQTTTSFTAAKAFVFSFLLLRTRIQTPGEKKRRERDRERESQITEASEESSHAPQCTLNPNPKTRGIGEEERTEREGGKGSNKGIKFSNFVYKISPITGHRVPTLGRCPVTASNQSPGK
jgi:hypothetical protein